MNTDLFFANFGYLADAPNSVKKLRELILQLAVRGKLVPQDPNDEPASVLLTKIKAEKERLSKENKIRKPPPLPPVSPDDIPYELPQGWEWVRLGMLGITQTGTTPATSNAEFFGSDYPFIKPADISDKGVRYDISKGLSKKGIEKGRLIEAFSVLMVCIGGSISKVGYIDRDCSCNQQINTITPFKGIDYRTLTYFMVSPFFKDQVIENAPSTTLPILSKGKWEALPIPIPPEAEQRRIVDKVDQLMSLCDGLEARQQKKKQKLLNLNNAALDRLLTARETYDFANAWRLICDNFDFLYTAPETITKLRQAILQLAVQGKLTPQDPKDEPASVLLAKIKAEKERLIKEKKIKKTPPLPPVSPDETPCELPKGWEWVRFGEVCTQITDGVHATPTYVLKGVPFISVNNLYGNKISFLNCKYILEKDHQSLVQRCRPELGDILMGKVGSLGVCDVVETDQAFSIFVQIALIKPVRHYLNSYFIKYSILSNLFRYQLNSQTAGTALKYIGIGKIANLLIPLPPIAEQHRIVNKVDQLMKLCDELEAKLIKSQTKSEKLLEAAVKAIASN